MTDVVLDSVHEAFQGRVRCWRLHLDLTQAPNSAVLDLLAPEERQVLQRFQQQEDRVRFAGVRAALRQVLAVEYGLKQPVQIQRDPFGKPVLAEPCGLEFNVSHAGALGLIAVSRVGWVGVDVERQLPLEIASLAELACTPLERETLARLDEAAQRVEFFRLWVGKEAALKAVGTGIAGGHMSLLSLLDNGCLRAEGSLPFNASLIQVEALPVSDGYCAAVALSFCAAP